MLYSGSPKNKKNYTNTTHTMTPKNIKQSLHMDESFYNQVPKRFSQFILDQQDPMAQRLDNLSIDSPYSSVVDFGRSKKKSSSNENNLNLVRNISDSMDSQATIFSTRQNPQALLRRRSTRKKRKSQIGFLPRKLRASFQSNLHVVTSNQSSLKRSNAIKSKHGSLMYRLKLQFKKIMRRFRYVFRVSSKRTTSNATMNRKLSRKYRENPRNMSLQKAKRNPTIVKQRKAEIAVKLGYKHESESQLLIPTNEKDIHVSDFIDEQQLDYLRTVSCATDQKQIREMLGRTDSTTVKPPKAKSILLVDKQEFLNPYDGLEAIELWRSYLGQALSKRIQLRHEINLFLSFVANKNSPKFENDIKKSTVDNICTDLISACSINDAESAGSFVDENAKEFHNHINRKSVLDDMLEYDSSDELWTSISDDLDRTNSMVLSVYKMSRYGTVKRTTKSTNNSLKRSSGIQHNLAMMR
jgi:hypothetical protein